MPVKIGAAPEHNFDQPLELLSDCHRRIERFLAVLSQVAEGARGRALGADEKRSLTTALRYFREAAPRHTADEEESLFPRMRACGGPEVAAALDRVATLEADHVRANQLHADVDEIFSEWL